MGEKKSKRTQKTDKEQKEIIAFYLECNNYSETARKFGMSDTGVRKIIKRHAGSESTKQLEEKKNNNTKEVIQDMNDRKENTKKLLGKLLQAIEDKVDNIDMFTTVRDLAMAYGTIIDKEFKWQELELKKKELELQAKELESDKGLSGSIIQAIQGQMTSIWDDEESDVKTEKEKTQ
ncbi:MAG: hypothetical protein J5982_03380 [Bacilli bacterium]|nr:hypothetical protein [Bacilli bacterium]